MEKNFRQEQRMEGRNLSLSPVQEGGGRLTVQEERTQKIRTEGEGKKKKGRKELIKEARRESCMDRVKDMDIRVVAGVTGRVYSIGGT